MGLKKFLKRGEIYLVCLDPTIGSEINKTRPALIISNNINNQAAQTVTVIPITSSVEKVYPFEARLSTPESGLRKRSKAKCNQIRTVDKKRLAKRIGRVSSKELAEIEEAILIHLGISLRL
ncbi:MAG: type II toxin-antitoxin system PemK/MazF family toxin [Fidelibacterota bacterium]